MLKTQQGLQLSFLGSSQILRPSVKMFTQQWEGSAAMEVAQQDDMPTLLTSRASRPLRGDAVCKPQRRMEIAIPEPQQLQEYPEELVCIRNTFIHVERPAAESAIGRMAVSCPSRHIGKIHDSLKDETRPAVVESSSKQLLCLEEALREPVMTTPEASGCSGRMGMMRWSDMCGTPENNSNFVPDPSFPQGLLHGVGFQNHEDDIPLCPAHFSPPSEPAPGSAEMPSIGSREHASGECKPCAFLHAKGCQNGIVCKFCHLCPAGEKKRRAKAKKDAFRGGA